MWETLFPQLVAWHRAYWPYGTEVRHGMIIARPPLDVTRKDALIISPTRGPTHVTDSSNLLNDVKRNRLRNVILPP